MIVDASALVAIALAAPQADTLADKLRDTDLRHIGTPTLLETGIVLAAKIRSDAKLYLTQLLVDFDIEPLAFGEQHWRVAFDAALRYGKGRHPAGLNFGDCMTYAVAKVSGRPLLCTGDDFARTDLVLA